MLNHLLDHLNHVSFLSLGDVRWELFGFCFCGRTPQYPYHRQYHHYGLTAFWKGPLTAHLLEMGQDAEQDPLVARSPCGIFHYCEVFLYICVLSSACGTELLRLELKSILQKNLKKKKK